MTNNASQASPLVQRRANELRAVVLDRLERVIADPWAVVGRRFKNESRDRWAARAIIEELHPQ